MTTFNLGSNKLLFGVRSSAESARTVYITVSCFSQFLLENVLLFSAEFVCKASPRVTRSYIFIRDRLVVNYFHLLS